MAACWKQLSQQPDVQLRVVAWATSPTVDQSCFDASITEAIDCRLLSVAERNDADIIEHEINSFHPDVVVIPGWLSPAYTTVVLRLKENRPGIVMGMDTPWTGRVRQRLTSWRYAQLFHKVDHVVVAGERTWQYAKHLGFPESQISRGVYGWDKASFSISRAPRRTGTSSRNFVFVGRFAEEKGIVTLLDAYQRYRQSVSSPWPLTMCGSGPLSELIQGEGIRSVGFVQPADLPSVLRESDVFVLPSHYEPWGVALAEAMGAGLPVIATEACGAALDLVRSYWNGLLVSTGSAAALAESFVWFHQHEDRLEEMGINAQQAAEPFSADNWGVRWKAVLDGVIRQRAA